MFNCTLCRNITFQKNAISAEERQECGSTAEELIKVHFWFSNQIVESKKADKHSIVCRTCWTKLENFHEFFCAVKFNYQITDEDEAVIEEEALDESFEADQEVEWQNSQKNNETAHEENHEFLGKCEFLDEDRDELIDAGENILDIEMVQEDLVMENSPAHCTRRKRVEIITRAKEVQVVEIPIKKPMKKVHEETTNKKIQLTADDEKVIKEHADMKCEKCSFKFSGWHNAVEHYKLKHKEKGFLRCCGRKIDRISEMFDHVKFHLDPNIFTCQQCRKVMLTREYLVVHEATHIPQELRQFQCPLCDKKFGSAFSLLCHKRNHKIDSMEPTIPCPECPDKMFKTQALLKLHKGAVHNVNGPFMCEFCSKQLKTKYTLEIHVKTHTDPVKPIQCNLCGHYIKNKRRFAVHMSRHREAEKGPYPCEECEKEGIAKTFKIKHQLKAHFSHVHTTKRLRCDECGKEFKHKKNLFEHQAQHSGIDLYQCPFCPRTFKSNGNMHSHKKKMHPNEYSTLPPPSYLKPIEKNDE